MPPSEGVVSAIYEACRRWMSRFTCECVIPQMNAACHIWMHMNGCNIPLQHHIPLSERLISCMYKSCHIWMSYILNKWVTSKNIVATSENPLQYIATHCNTKNKSRRHKREEATRHNGTNKVRRAVCCLWVPDGKVYSASLPPHWLLHAATHNYTP